MLEALTAQQPKKAYSELTLTTGRVALGDVFNDGGTSPRRSSLSALADRGNVRENIGEVRTSWKSKAVRKFGASRLGAPEGEFQGDSPAYYRNGRIRRLLIE